MTKFIDTNRLKAMHDNPTEIDVPLRAQYLHEGIGLTMGDRNRQYGEPAENFAATAGLWNAYLAGKYPGQFRPLTMEDVAWLNVLLKISRAFKGPKADTFIDAAVYAAIAGELADHEAKEQG